MPIFISYSHQDKDFVDVLAAMLIKFKARVWLDRWELQVGDSIVNRIQEAIQESDALIVVISKASMQSEWCKKELSAGFLRELEEKKVLVLPVLIEECDMPVFLREKKYADFTKNFNDGLADILEAIASITSDTMGRIQEKPSYNIDWSIDWGFLNKGNYVLNLTFVDHGEIFPYIVLTEVNIIADENATAHHKKNEADGKEYLTRYAIIRMLSDFAKQNNDLQIILDDSFPKKRDFMMSDPNLDLSFNVIVRCRRLGKDTGRDVLMDFGNLFIMTQKKIEEVVRNFPNNFADKF